MGTAWTSDAEPYLGYPVFSSVFWQQDQRVSQQNFTEPVIDVDWLNAQCSEKLKQLQVLSNFCKNNPALAYILNMELHSMESYKLNTDNQNCFVGWLQIFW